MRSAALPKKRGHPAPAQIPYVRVLVQNKKAARAQQGYVYILAETSPFGKLFRRLTSVYRTNKRKEKSILCLFPLPYQHAVFSTDATKFKNDKATPLISILRKHPAQTPQKAAKKKGRPPFPLPFTFYATDPLRAQRPLMSSRLRFPRWRFLSTLQRAGF